MIIFFPKKGKHKEGELMFSFPEVFKNPDLGFRVKEDGVVVLDSSDFDHVYLMPLEALPFNDPTNPANIHNYKVKFTKNGKVEHIHHKDNPKDTLIHVQEKDITEMMDLWGQTYTVLKGLHPKLKISEALQKEQML